MSIERVPKDVDSMLMTLHYQDGFCIVQAIWDKPTIERLEKKGNCVLLYHKNSLRVYVRMAKNSEKITRALCQKIADRWLSGSYVKVESPLFPDFETRDWIS